MIDPDDFHDSVFSADKIIEEGSDQADFRVRDLYPGFALGFRSWQIHEEQGRQIAWLQSPILAAAEGEILEYRSDRLYSDVREEEWRRGVNRAICKNPGSGHEAPGADCHCGYNAFFRTDLALDYAEMIHSLIGFEKTAYGFYYLHNYIVGAILGWGDLQIHRDGFRSQYAVVIGLLDRGMVRDNHLQALAEYYRVPIFASEGELEEYSRGLGTSLG